MRNWPGCQKSRVHEEAKGKRIVGYCSVVKQKYSNNRLFLKCSNLINSID